MASVELRPGDTLNIVWSSVQDTPLGVKEVESSFAFSYEELLIRLKSSDKAKSHKNGSEGVRFSRFVALSINAIQKGKWSTGAFIDKTEVIRRLLKRIQKLSVEEYENITPHALKALGRIDLNSSSLEENEKIEVRNAINQILQPNK